MRRGRFLFLLLLIAATLIAYFPSFSAQFIFDDIKSIQFNPDLNRLWPFHSDWFNHPVAESLSHRPLIRFSLALNYALGGLDPWGYHALNVAIHALAVLVLFGLLWRTLMTDRLRSRYGAAAEPLAFSIALIWAVHPLNTQAVTFLTQRAESLMALFYLLTLYALVRQAQEDRGWGWGIACVTFCALGMATKQVLVTAPAAALLYDRTFLAGSFRGVWRERKWLHLSLAATWGVLLFLILWEPFIKTGGFHFQQYGVVRNLITQCGILPHYLRLAFWPDPLVLDYFWKPAAGFRDVMPAGLLPPLMLAATLVLFWVRPAAGFLGAWFFITQAPHTLVPMPREIAAEHRMYLPLIAVIAALVLAVYRLLASPGPARRFAWGPALLLAAVIPLSARAFVRNSAYQDPVRLWSEDARHQPQSPHIHFNLGAALLRERRYTEAAAELERSVQLAPQYADAWEAWGYALEKQGIAAEAALYKGISKMKKGHYSEAGTLIRRGLELKPGDSYLHGILGAALAQQHQVDEAAAHFSEALRLDPANEAAAANLQTALREKQSLSIPPDRR